MEVPVYLFTGFLEAGKTSFIKDLLTDEERAYLRRSHWQLISGLTDFAGVIVGTAAILVLMMLLISLINWLVGDLSQSFILLQKHL